jgi:hypothetical protein
MKLKAYGSPGRLEHASEPIQDYAVDDRHARSSGWDGGSPQRQGSNGISR